LNYNLAYNTANGQVKAAQTNISSLAVGPIKLSNVSVSISQNNGGVSLLGMTFFNQLSKYEVQEGKMTLYK
jgi:aspartyl protease family protein